MSEEHESVRFVKTSSHQLQIKVVVFVVPFHVFTFLYCGLSGVFPVNKCHFVTLLFRLTAEQVGVDPGVHVVR